MRRENPDEPMWQGVESMESQGSGVEMVFKPGYDPELRPSGGVEVACVLHPEPVTTEPARPEQ